MPIKIKEKDKDTDFLAKALVAFSILQLAVGLILFILATTTGWMIAVMGCLTLLGILLAHFAWEKHVAIRVVGRTLNYLIGIFFLGLEIADICMGFYMNREIMSQAISKILWEYNIMMICGNVQAVFLFIIPAMAFAAWKGRTIDLVMLRIFSLLELAMALLTFIVQMRSDILTLSINNLWFTGFFCLCVLGTAVSTFAIYPFWKPKSIKRIEEKREAMRQNVESEEEKTSCEESEQSEDEKITETVSDRS